MNRIKKLTGYTLGLDMGVASIGWAVTENASNFIDAGVRIFPAGIDNFGTSKQTHLNQVRRAKRGSRRLCERKSKRLTLLRNILTKLGWMPLEAQALETWTQQDVYLLRSRAISEKLTLSEIGRIIYHLNQRRGFLSLRKNEAKSKSGKEADELKGMLGEIEQLKCAIQTGGYKTLGNYLHHIYQKSDGQERLRKRHTLRSMIYDEFSLIWQTQSAHHPELNDTLRYGSHGRRENPTNVTKPVPRMAGKSLLEQFGLENITFLQRCVYWRESSIGQCELEKSQFRAPLADRRFQEFRMLSELNNLRIFDRSTPNTPVERTLTDAERTAALAYLSHTEKPSLAGLRKKIAALPSSPAATQFTLNLEANKRESISGLETEMKLEKVLDRKWTDLADLTKNQLVDALVMPQFDAKSRRATQRTDPEMEQLLLSILPSLTVSEIAKLIELYFPAGTCGLSAMALERLLPHMRRGLVYQGKDETNSARHLAGYPRRDEDQKLTLDLLPRLEDLTDPEHSSHDPHFPQINNPLVLRSLHELRKVVNGIVRKYGKPARIHIEMARDLKMNSKQREEHANFTKQNEKDRAAASKALLDMGIWPTYDSILLHRLWIEQNKQCLYSGKPISFESLTTGLVDIDHIYPRRAGDDSYMNKVLCFSSENRAKNDRLPAIWLAGDQAKFDALTQRAASLPVAKQKRIAATQIPDHFTSGDLNDTAYMARTARHYLSLLVEQPHHVFCTKGKHTAFLRKRWEIQHLLETTAKPTHQVLDGPVSKNREDHRHHALDAIVIALCTPSLVQKISQQLKYQGSWKEADTKNGKTYRLFRLKPAVDDLSPPWPAFPVAVKSSLDAIWVSHRPDRKVSGPLHEETNYGATTTPGEIVIRKSLASLKPEFKKLKDIRDSKIREIVIAYVQREKHLYRGDFPEKLTDEIKDLFARYSSLDAATIASIEFTKLREALAKKLADKNPLVDAEHGKITMPSGTPIRKVRLLTRNETAFPLRPKLNPKELVIPGNTHHFVIFTIGDGKCLFVPATLLDVTQRKVQKQPLIQKTPPPGHPTAEYIMYLCKGDAILAGPEGARNLFIYKTMAATSLQTFFVAHNDARKKSKKGISGVHEVSENDIAAEDLESEDLGKEKGILITAKPSTFLKNFPDPIKVDVLPHGELRKTS